MEHRLRWLGVAVAASVLSVSLQAQKPAADPAGGGVGDVSRLTHAKSRSISPENFTGEKGKGGMATEGTGAKAARDLGQGWKVSPSVRIKSKTTFTLADVAGQGAIQHVWMTPTGTWRYLILRFYWDGETTPSVEVPAGDFFASGWGGYAQISSLAVCVNPGSAFNSYWEMPFRKGFRVTAENLADDDMTLYYQIDYALTEVPADAAYFHAQFRRVNPLPEKEVYTILDGVRGQGHYVGTYLAWGVHNNGWWGEGEIKFYMDGDSKFPTIAGTGTEDYFCGSYDFDAKAPDGTIQYHEFTTPYTGLPQVIRGDGHYQVQQRFGMYRWHIMDPVRFDKDLRITIQDLGWRQGSRYLAQKSDIASVCYWYQAEPHAKFPAIPGWQGLEVN